MFRIYKILLLCVCYGYIHCMAVCFPKNLNVTPSRFNKMYIIIIGKYHFHKILWWFYVYMYFFLKGVEGELKITVLYVLYASPHNTFEVYLHYRHLIFLRDGFFYFGGFSLFYTWFDLGVTIPLKWGFSIKV